MTPKRTKSQAKAEFWATIPEEQRKAMASHAAKAKQSKMTAKEKRAHALKMLSARNGKIYN